MTDLERAERTRAAAMARTQAVRAIWVGGLLTAFGLVLTVVTYAMAASNPQGGHYVVAFGPVIFGVITLLRGLARLRVVRLAVSNAAGDER